MSIVLHRMVAMVVVVVAPSGARGVREEGLRFADAVKGIALVVVEAV
jgi:hypothetical protein